MLAVMVNYLCSAMFHDLTLVPAQEWLLFLFAGLTVNLLAEWRLRDSKNREPAQRLS